jgi:hypothetical protein
MARSRRYEPWLTYSIAGLEEDQRKFLETSWERKTGDQRSHELTKMMVFCYVSLT